MRGVVIFSIILFIVGAVNVCEAQSKGGKKTVHNIEFWFNGEKRAEEFVINNKRDSTYTTWYSNGNKREMCEYEAGKRNGEYKQWFLNGVIKTEGTYSFGRKEGEWTQFKKDGSVATTKSF